MPSLTPAAVRKQIKSGATAPLYLLFGEDEAAKAELAAEFAEVVDEALRAFNVSRLYGGEAAPSDILDAVRTVPMMASRRVVVVLRAERLLSPKRESTRAERELAALEAYFKAPQPHATLVLVAAELDKRRRITTLLLKQATIVECGGVADVRDARRWIQTKVAAAGMRIDADAVRLMAERAGQDIGRLRGDVERVLLYAADRRKIEVSDVRDVTGPAVAQDEWAVTRAIERGAVAPALRELALTLEAGAAPYMVLGQLGWVVRTKLPAPRVPAAVEALYRTDLDLKSSAGDPRVLLERLVVELCGGGGRPLRRG